MQRKAKEAHAQTLVVITSNFLLPQLIVSASVVAMRASATGADAATTLTAVSRRAEDVQVGARASSDGSRSRRSGDRPTRMWSNRRRDRHSVTYMHDGGDTRERAAAEQSEGRDAHRRRNEFSYGGVRVRVLQSTGRRVRRRRGHCAGVLKYGRTQYPSVDRHTRSKRSDSTRLGRQRYELSALARRTRRFVEWIRFSTTLDERQNNVTVAGD